MLMKICGLLGLSADYILYGDERKADESLSDKIHRIDEKYLITIYELLMSTKFDVYMSEFYINKSKFEHLTLQNHVTGVVYKTELIKDIRTFLHAPNVLLSFN